MKKQIGKKVTEKVLGRVLLSSISCILACMVCLVSTTWAWFAVSVENNDNVIQIGRPEVTVTVNGSTLESGTELPMGVYKLTLVHANTPDALSQKSTIYVTLTLDGTKSQYVILGGYGSDEIELDFNVGKPCHLSWDVTWFEPANADYLIDNIIVVEADTPVETTETATEPTEGMEVPSEEAIEPTEVVAEPSEGATEPTAGLIEPSEEPTEPKKETIPEIVETQPAVQPNNIKEDEFPLTPIG